MRGAYGAFGETEPVAEEEAGGGGMVSLLQEYAPAVRLFAEQVSDPVRKAAILRAELERAIARGAPAYKIRKLQAELAAAERQVQLRMEGEQSTRQFRVLAQVGLFTGVAIGGVVLLILLRKAIR